MNIKGLKDTADRWLKRYERIGSIAASTAIVVSVLGLIAYLARHSSVPAWVPLILVVIGIVTTTIALEVGRHRTGADLELTLRQTEYQNALLLDALQSLQQALADTEWWSRTPSLSSASSARRGAFSCGSTKRTCGSPC